MAEEATKTNEDTKSEEVKPDIAEEALKQALHIEEKVEEAEVAEEAAEEAEAEDQEASGDESSEDESEAKVEAKEKNQVGYLTRQLKQKDEYIQKLEGTLKDGYVNQTDDTTEQRLRKVEADSYVREVTQARQSIVNDNERVTRDLPIFDPNSSEYNEQVHERALARYARDSIVADENGEIVGYKVPLYDYLTEEANLYLAGTQTGTKRRNTAKAKMAAAGDTPGSASAKKAEEKVDPFLAGFDSI